MDFVDLFNRGYISPKEYFIEYGFLATEDLADQTRIFADKNMMCRKWDDSDYTHGYMHGDAKRGDALVRVNWRTPSFYAVRNGKIVDPNGKDIESLQRKMS